MKPESPNRKIISVSVKRPYSTPTANGAVFGEIVINYSLGMQYQIQWGEYERTEVERIEFGLAGYDIHMANGFVLFVPKQVVTEVLYLENAPEPVNPSPRELYLQSHLIKEMLPEERYMVNDVVTYLLKLSSTEDSLYFAPLMPNDDAGNGAGMSVKIKL